MIGRRIRKWLPLVLLALAMTGAALLITFLPDAPRGEQARPTATAARPEPQSTQQAKPMADPKPLNDDDDDRADDTLDPNEIKRALPPLPNLLDDEDKEYPTPFSTPEPMPDESS